MFNDIQAYKNIGTKSNIFTRKNINSVNSVTNHNIYNKSNMSFQNVNANLNESSNKKLKNALNAKYLESMIDGNIKPKKSYKTEINKVINFINNPLSKNESSLEFIEQLKK